MALPLPQEESLPKKDMRALLQALPTHSDIVALPTRTDIESLILRLEETHRRDIQEVRGEISNIVERVSTGETVVTSLEGRVLALEQSRDQHRDAAVALQLHLEDIEDWSRRNNLRLRGILEDTGMGDLEGTVRGIFRTILEDQEAHVLLDRAQGPRSEDPTRPRDIVCRLHRYTQKETILRRTWDYGDMEIEGSLIRILPDLSRATLKQRALLRSLLDLAKQNGFTYRWGYPFAVMFRKDTSAFTLQTATDLPALFRFLGAKQIPVPDWLQLLP